MTSINDSYKQLKYRLKTTTNLSGDYFGELVRILAGSDKKLSSVQIRDLGGCILNYSITFICILLASAAIYFASVDGRAITQRYYIYTALIIIPVLVGSSLTLPIFKGGISSSSFIFTILGMIVMIIFIYFVMKNMNNQNVMFANYVLFVLLIFGIISSLAMFYRVFVIYLKSITGWKGFIIKLIFYIPCLLLDFIEFIINDYNNTPKIVGVIFVMQLIAIGLYIIVPKLYNYLKSGDRVILLEKTIYLTRASNIALNDALLLPEYQTSPGYLNLNPSEPTSIYTKYYSKNYTLSFWVYMLESGVNLRSNVEYNILQYGNDTIETSKRGKPQLVYYTDENGQGKYKMYFSDMVGGEAKNYTFGLELQKWNNIAVTYNNNIAELYINGELKYTYIFGEGSGKADIPTYSQFDKIIAGHDKEKQEGILTGLVCNVVYYRKPITKSEIERFYFSLKDKSPPI